MKKHYIILPLILSFLLSSCADKSNTINYIEDNFIPYTYPDNIIAKKVTIKDIAKADFNPTLSKNGFQFEDFRKDAAVIALLDGVKDAARKGLDQDARYKAIATYVGPFEQSLKNWAKTNMNSLQFDEEICGRGSYRNTNRDARTAADGDTQVEFAHIDYFPDQDLGNLFKITGFSELLLHKFGNAVTNKNFWKENSLSKMINIWMPLETVNAYPLAVLDLTTLDFKNYVVPMKVRVNGIAGELISGALRYSQEQQFYYKPGLERGQVIIFESFKTPHTAFITPEQQGDRESFDIRCAFIKRNQ